MSCPGETLTVLYDRDCGFCAWSAAWIQRADLRRRIRLLALQEAAADAHLAPLVQGRDLRCALHAVAGMDVHAGGAAILEIMERLPGGSLIRAWRRLPGAPWLSDRAYELAAARRDALGRLVGAEPGSACEVDP